MEEFEEVTGYLMSLDMSAGNTLLKNVSSFIDKEKMVGVEIDKKKETADGFMIIAGGERDYGNLSDEVIVAVDACKKIIAGYSQEPDSVTIIDENGTDMLKNEPDIIDKELHAAKPLQKENAPSAEPTDGILSIIDRIVGNDVLEIFGPTGSCKSKFSLHVAREYVKAGKKVYYLDTERNLTEDDIKSLNGCTYKYTPDIDEIEKLTRNLPKVDVVIIDSIGFPVLTTYARLNMKQKGDALLKMIAIFGDLKLWAYHNNGIAVVTNQPESEFNKGQGHVLRPFGDKSQFAAKEIWWLDPKTKSERLTTSNITAFRSRSMGMKTHIAKIEVTSDGVRVI